MAEPQPEKTRLQAHVDEKNQHKDELKRLAEQRDRLRRKFRSATNYLLTIPAGQDFLVGLFHLCGYNLTDAALDPQTRDVLEAASAHNMSRRSVYVDVRKEMDPTLRSKMELLAELPVEEEKKKEEN